MCQTKVYHPIKVGHTPDDTKLVYFLVGYNSKDVLVAEITKQTFTEMFGDSSAEFKTPRQFVDWLINEYGELIGNIIPSIVTELNSTFGLALSINNAS